MRKLWTIRWFRVLLGVVLTAALLAPVVLPALQMQRQEPENPIRKENIQPVRRLSFGDGDGGRLPPRRLRRKRNRRQPVRARSRILNSRRRSQTGENVPEQLPEQPRSDPEPQPGQESGEQPVRGPTASRTTPETRRSPTHSTLASYSPGTATAGSAIAHSARRIRPCGRTCALRSCPMESCAMSWSCAASTRSIPKLPT